MTVEGQGIVVLVSFAPLDKPDWVRGTLLAVGAAALGLWLSGIVFRSVLRKHQVSISADVEGAKPLRRVLIVSAVAGWVLVLVIVVAGLHAAF